MANNLTSSSASICLRPTAIPSLETSLQDSETNSPVGIFAMADRMSWRDQLLAPVNFPGFNLHFFGSRVNSDNSGLLTLTLCDTLGGVFQSNDKDRSTKRLCRQNEEGVLYAKVSNCSEQQCKLHYTPAVVIDNYNNIVVLPLGGLVEVNKDDINIVQAVDIHLFVGSSNNQKFLNVAKFGMFWWMLMNIAKIY
ncbi:hypothetical protein J3Q64DRAFT_1693879 [Phycomyces blakesleeanus]|uniref:Uncharacterized protein n=1 Tax=Phycomyces blakesleeanus TaxID=4837 RepID=A0ABR3BF10_PHYBL